MGEEFVDNFCWELTDSRSQKSYRIKGWGELTKAIRCIPTEAVPFWFLRLSDSSVTVSLERVLGHERRRFPRFEKTVRIKIIDSEKTFESSTLDVSVGGARIETELPDYILRANTIFVFEESGAQRPFILKFQIIENSSHGSRLKFVENRETSHRYVNWLRAAGQNCADLNSFETKYTSLYLPLK